MWEHVPLAWALISLATSESTQQLPAEREIFSVKSRALQWVLFYCAKHRFYKFTLWANQISCIKKKDKYAKFKCIRRLCSTLAGSRDREKETVNINRKANEVEHRGKNKALNVFVLSFASGAQWTHCRVNSHTRPPLTRKTLPLIKAQGCWSAVQKLLLTYRFLRNLSQYLYIYMLIFLLNKEDVFQCLSEWQPGPWCLYFGRRSHGLTLHCHPNHHRTDFGYVAIINFDFSCF